MSASTLVVLTPGFPESEADSTCLPFVQNVVKALADAEGHDKIIVVAFQYPFVRKTYHWNGILVHALNGQNRSGVLRIVTWMRAWRLLASVVRSEKVSGILAMWLGECALVAKRFAARNRIPYFIWLQGQDARKGNRYVRRVAPEPGRLIAISTGVADELHKNYGIRAAHITGNGIDPSQYPELNAGTRNIDVIGVGSLSAVKKFSAFVKVIARVKGSHPSVSAVIVGEGPERPMLEKMIAEYQLQENLTLTGSLPHGRVLSLMNDARVLLHTSSYEGDASVVLEALYSGCAVVCNAGIVSNSIEGVVSVHGFDAMAPAVLRLLNDSRHNKRTRVNTAAESVGSVLRLFRQQIA